MRAIALVPREPDGSLRLLLPDGDLPDADQFDSETETLEAVRNAKTIVFAEVRGIGSTEPEHERRNWDGGRFGASMREFFLAYLNGDSFVGMRAEDVAMWTSNFRSHYDIDQIELVGEGEVAIPALHAAALSPDFYSRIELQRMIPSWRSILSEEESTNQLVNTVHGALLHYELSDLVKLIGSDKVHLTDPVDVRGNLISATAK